MAMRKLSFFCTENFEGIDSLAGKFCTRKWCSMKLSTQLIDMRERAYSGKKGEK